MKHTPKRQLSVWTGLLAFFLCFFLMNSIVGYGYTPGKLKRMEENGVLIMKDKDDYPILDAAEAPNRTSVCYLLEGENGERLWTVAVRAPVLPLYKINVLGPWEEGDTVHIGDPSYGDYFHSMTLNRTGDVIESQADAKMSYQVWLPPLILLTCAALALRDALRQRRTSGEPENENTNI